MGSSGKKKTTMAKLARENRLRERRLNKKAKKDARKLASSEEGAPEELDDLLEPADRVEASPAETPGHTDEAVRAFREVESEPIDPRSKEVALTRLRDATDEELAVFRGTLREDAFAAGATEQETRQAQEGHPEQGA